MDRESQRAALARALVNSPRLVLADEPTGSLDSAAAAEVVLALREVARSGAAVLLVTHDATVAAAATRVIRMRDGRVVDADSP